jgi:hypothetical protein
MTYKTNLAVALTLAVASSQAYSLAYAEGRVENRAEGHTEGHSEGRKEARPSPPPRPAPQRFQAHPPGAHPHGAVVRAHPVRVLSPRVVRYGGSQWHHWAHAEFSRPVYFWEWAAVRYVTCIAEDSYGDQYPVTEATFSGFGLVNMTGVEDDALDRCAAESGGDESCYLATCSHF